MCRCAMFAVRHLIGFYFSLNQENLQARFCDFFIRTVLCSIPRATPVVYVLSRIPGNPLPLREPGGDYVISLFMSAHAVLQGGYAKQSMANYQPSEI